MLAAVAAFAQPRRVPSKIPPMQRPDAFSVVERFERMSPAQKQPFLDRLPPERKKQFELRLRRYGNMSPEQRQQVREQYELFQGLPRDRQEALRKAFRQFSELPVERRRVLRLEYLRLRQMPEADRRTHIDSGEFRSRYSPAEQQLLGELAKTLPPPRPPATQYPASK